MYLKFLNRKIQKKKLYIETKKRQIGDTLLIIYKKNKCLDYVFI